MPRTKPSVGRTLLAIFNILLIIAILLMSGLMALSSLKSGTFTLFDKSWYYYQSDVMTGEVERGEMLIISGDSPNTFQPDDIVAFYESDARGNRVIQIATLLEKEGSLYQLTEADGEVFTIDSTETVFVGKVTGHSALLGHFVQQMKTSDGRKIYFRWSVALLMFACGLILLLHVQQQRRLPTEPEYDEYDDYDEPYEDEDYPEEEEGMQLDRLPTDPHQPAYEDEYDDEYEEDSDDDGYTDEEQPGYVDEDNMNLIAASTESEDEEEVDFEAIFREIRRQTRE